MSILFIGGTNIDYIATSDEPLISHSSNIGKLEISFGGVMRNVVENCARLGAECHFITIIGQDTLGKTIKKYMEDLGVKLYSPVTLLNTSSYIAINNNNHDMEVGINDMKIMDKLTPNFLASLNELISKHDYIFLDSNLSPLTIDYIFKKYSDHKIVIEGISATKILRYKLYINKIYMVKCNVYEARSIADMKDGLVADVALKILDMGAKSVVVSQGKGDIYYGENNQIKCFKLKTKDVFKGNTTGCGDALFSGIADHISEGYSLKDSLEFATKLSVLTLDSDKANNPEVSRYAYVHKK